MNDQEFEEFREKYCGGIYCKTSAELKKRIDKIVNGPHTYETSAEAIVKVAMLAKQYVYHKLGNTGFQAGWADLEELAVSRWYQDGFIILDGNKLLYPQYDIDEEFEEWKQETRKALKAKASKLLETESRVHPDVRRRWEEIANHVDIPDVKL
jgi:hypothetical protein